MGEANLERPFAAELTVERARDQYLAENGFTVAAYQDPYVELNLWGVHVKLPNTAARKKAVKWHDLHHVATGFGTDPEGEAVISAWEARHGVGPLGLYVGALVLGGWLLGLVLYTGRVRWAWRSSSSTPGLFHERLGSYEQVLQLSVAELREYLELPREGLEDRQRARHADAPALAAEESEPR